MTQPLSRRRFLRGAGLLGLSVAAGGLAAPYYARGANNQIRIVSNPGLENATLNALMDEMGYFRQFGVDAQTVQIPGTSGPFDAIALGAADLCMVSGYNGVLSRIAQGAKVKIVGAGMKKCALTVFARPDEIRTLADLQGRTIAVGPKLGLLHTLMRQLMKEKGIDATQIDFVDKGSNDQCYEAVVKGEADACCSSISHLRDQDGLVAISDANLWQALPRCIFQTAYASDAALRSKHEELVAVMAAYGALYDYLMSPASHDAFFQARKQAQKKFDKASAQAIWDFNETQRPYSKDLSLTSDDIAYLQDMFIGVGSLKQKQPFTDVADMSAANAAAKLIG
ncbi:ABC transporter substrate-binding protein [Paraburkholderia caribensis]|uniref:ABC transporter substrate-binding protein n=1 Tax=Paraburkholderia caribensis TaxID=75105 RepID=UPI001CAE7CD2|nr:ABC transporter substrate-binding protein [Paraburkholderia caribensis]CAG9259240.1 ABC-type nitrate/sulfonate/bicarbonate transport system periplasmic component-like protein [Paraburkholderia caribensis]